MVGFVKPLFHTDSHARFLLKSGACHANVFENSFGAQFFGSAHNSRELADRTPGKRRKPIYRIVVRLK